MRFTLGFAHLWRGNFEQAVAHCEAALELAERVGDLVIQSRCLTYLAVAHRGCASVEQAATCAKRTLELATKVGMIEYVAMAKANLAWVAWRENSQGEAESLAHEALKLWHGMDDPYSFDWMALWPLGALAYARGNTAEAIEHLRALLDPNQHPLPETLTNLARQAIDAWEAGDSRQAHATVAAALSEAKKQGQL